MRLLRALFFDLSDSDERPVGWLECRCLKKIYFSDRESDREREREREREKERKREREKEREKERKRERESKSVKLKKIAI